MKTYHGGRHRLPYPIGDQIIKHTGSVIHWNTISPGHGKDRENRLCAIVTCGSCKRDRWVPTNALLKATRTKRFSGCCVSCQHKLPWEKKWRDRPPTRKLCRGYVKLYLPQHPMRDKRGEVLQHRIVMAEILGRPLTRHEHVHHKNRNRSDNRPENLELVSSHSHALITRLNNRIQHLETFITCSGLNVPASNGWG